jgi:hypothetical protein
MKARAVIEAETPKQFIKRAGVRRHTEWVPVIRGDYTMQWRDSIYANRLVLIYHGLDYYTIYAWSNDGSGKWTAVWSLPVDTPRDQVIETAKDKVSAWYAEHGE